MLIQRLSLALKDLISGVRQYRVWLYMARHDVFARYRRSLLGPFWVSGSMIATSIALSIVMGGVLGQPLPEILPYITSGILCWTIAGLVFNEGAETFMQATNTIKSHPFPFTVYPIRLIARNAFVFLHSFVVYVVLVIALKHSLYIHWQVLLGVPLMMLFAFFSSALAGLMAARYRDLRFLLPYLGQIIFFLTPIFWKADHMHGLKAALVNYNVFYYTLTVAREPLLGHSVPLHIWGSAVAITVALAIVYFFVFAAVRRRIPFWV